MEKCTKCDCPFNNEKENSTRSHLIGRLGGWWKTLIGATSEILTKENGFNCIKLYVGASITSMSVPVAIFSKSSLSYCLFAMGGYLIFSACRVVKATSTPPGGEEGRKAIMDKRKNETHTERIHKSEDDINIENFFNVPARKFQKEVTLPGGQYLVVVDQLGNINDCSLVRPDNPRKKKQLLESSILGTKWRRSKINCINRSNALAEKPLEISSKNCTYLLSRNINSTFFFNLN